MGLKGFSGTKEKGGEAGMSKALAGNSLGKNKGEKGGEKFMRILIGLIAVVIFSGIASALTTDSVLLTITPSFNLSVNISSASYDFGSSVDLGTTRTICVGQIENDGNVASKWQKATASQTGTTGNTWTLLTGNNNNPNDLTGIDTFKLLIVSTGTGVEPDLTSTNTSNRCLIGNHDLLSPGIGSNYNDLTEGGAASPIHPKSETRKLWVSLLMPTNITTDAQQTITLSVQALTQ